MTVSTGPAMSPHEQRRRCAELLFAEGLTEDDQRWLRQHFALAGLPTPKVDVSWLQTGEVRG